MAKSDLDSILHCLPMNQNSLQCLGMMVQGKIYIECTLPFGCSTSCCIFIPNTVLSQIVVPLSNCGLLLFFNLEINYDLLKIDIVLIQNNIISSMGQRTCIPTMLFVIFLWFAPIFLQNVNLNLTF